MLAEYPWKWSQGMEEARAMLLEVTISSCLFELSNVFTRCCFLTNALLLSDTVHTDWDCVFCQSALLP